MRTQAINGAKWFVTFIDDSSRWCEVYFLKSKAGVLEAFKKYKSSVEKQLGRKIKCVQSDNGREYCNQEFNKLLDNEGIRRRLTVARTPQQNGVAERMNRTLVDMARCLMLQSKIQKEFWADAIATACHIRNRCPSSSINGKTPYEKWRGELPNFTYLRTFGVPVYVLNKDPAKDKFAERTLKGIFIGYPRETKGYRVWLPNERKQIIARDVKFQETLHLNINGKCIDVPDDISKNISCEDLFDSDFILKKSETSNSPSPNQITGGIPELLVRPDEIEVNINRRGRGRPRLVRTGSRGRPQKLFQSAPETVQEGENQDIKSEEEVDDDVFAGAVEISLNDAMCSPQQEEWERAIQLEVESLIKNNTLDIVKRSEGRNIVGSRVVLMNKYDTEGNIEKRKARIVAKGYSQRYGVDFHQTFAPVARLDSIRLLFALSAHFKMKIRQFDIVTAYLNGKLDEEVFMEVPDMFPQMLEVIAARQDTPHEVRQNAKKMLRQFKDGENICKLRKALYGLRQAGRKWHEILSSKLKEIGLQPTKGEPCMYHAKRNENLLFLVVYVDDLLIASNDDDWINEIKSKLGKSFEIKHLGLAKHCLGFEITREEGSVIVTQRGYINDILNKYGMNECNPVMTPAELKPDKPSNNNMEIKENNFGTDQKGENRKYRELIGSLMYLAVGTRPDIANTVSRLAQFINNPQQQNIKSAKRILRYLAGTKTLGIKYSKSNNGVIGYSDADWGGCTVDRRSYTGYVFIFAGGAIAWKSQKQSAVALSSTEAEYVSMSESVKEVLHLRSLLEELGLHELTDIKLYVDNRGAKCLASDPVYHARTKHIDIRHHFIRDAIEKGFVTLYYIPTDQMAADILTKPLVRVTHWRCIQELGCCT